MIKSFLLSRQISKNGQAYRRTPPITWMVGSWQCTRSIRRSAHRCASESSACRTDKVRFKSQTGKVFFHPVAWAAASAIMKGRTNHELLSPGEGAPMRIVCFLILLILLAAVVVFAVQNNETVTLRFFYRSVSGSLALLIAVVYLLGMISGWTVVGFLRRSVRGLTERRRN